MSHPVKVVTWQSPDGEKINITPHQEQLLRAAGTWPKTSRGAEYCQVYRGLHFGVPASNEELGISDCGGGCGETHDAQGPRCPD